MTEAASGPASTASWQEDERLAALQRYQVLDTPPETVFDDIVRLASQICRTPMAAVSLVDEARQWFKAEIGLGVLETPRGMSFCAHAIQTGGLFQVPDATLDPLFCDNPLVTGQPHIRFYAGAVLQAPDAMPLGALCVIGVEPRPEGLTEEQALVLQALARQVVTQLELRRALIAERDANARLTALAEVRERSAEELRASEARLHLAMRAGLVGAWDWDIAAARMYGDAQIAQALQIDAEDMANGIPIAVFEAVIHPEDRAWVVEAVRKAFAETSEFAEEYRVVTGVGTRWIFSRGRGFRDDAGQPARCTGIAIDITQRKKTEEALVEANVGRELAMQAGQLGRWDHNPSQGTYYWDPRTYQVLGLAPGQAVSFDLLLSLVHPEDRDRVARALDRAMIPERIGAYAEEYRIIRADTRETRWLSALGRSTFEDGRCVRFVGMTQDITERKLAEAHQRLLTNELNHRVKNTLAIVQSLVSQTLRSVASPRDAYQAITDRLIALGRAHDILTRTNWSAAPMAELVASVTEAMSVAPGRVQSGGPGRQLAPKPALSLAMALHELATNAVKYGALSNSEGWVRITWSVDPTPRGARFRLRWSEHDGPPVTAPSRQGFGAKMIQGALARELEGEANLTFHPSGVVWTVDAPLEAVEERAAG